jgi:Putative transposase
LKEVLLVSESSTEKLRVMLETQYERWWNVYVDPIKLKWHFLHYVARYVGRPPIAQHRFTKITSREVEFLTKGSEGKAGPQRLSWRNSLHKHFGVDPLVDSRRSIHALGRSAEACCEVRRSRVDSLSKATLPPSKYFSPHSASLRFCSAESQQQTPPNRSLSNRFLFFL